MQCTNGKGVIFMKKYLRKITVLLFSVLVLVLAANISTGNISLKKGPDALTSATVKNKGETATVSGVNGNFTVLINNEKAPEGTVDFFTCKRKDAPDGLKCRIAHNDKKAAEFMGYMGIGNYSSGDALMLISAAEYKRFDVIVLSKKTADTYTAKSLYDKNYVTAVEIKGE